MAHSKGIAIAAACSQKPCIVHFVNSCELDGPQNLHPRVARVPKFQEMSEGVKTAEPSQLKDRLFF